MLGNYEVAAVQQSMYKPSRCTSLALYTAWCNCILTMPLHLQQQHNNSGHFRTITLCSVQRCQCHMLIFLRHLAFLIEHTKMPITEYITVLMTPKPLFVKSKTKIAFVFFNHFLAWFANMPVDD